MLMNSNSLKYGSLSSLQPHWKWLKSGVFCSMSVQGCGHPSQPPQWLQKTFVPSPIVGRLCEICLLCGQSLPPFSPPKKSDWGCLNRNCNFRGNSRAAGIGEPALAAVGRLVPTTGDRTLEEMWLQPLRWVPSMGTLFNLTVRCH